MTDLLSKLKDSEAIIEQVMLESEAALEKLPRDLGESRDSHESKDSELRDLTQKVHAAETSSRSLAQELERLRQELSRSQAATKAKTAS